MLPIRTLAASAVALTALGGGAVALPSAAHARPASEVVSIGGLRTQAITINLLDDRFMPAGRTIKKGSTITFVWKGEQDHNVHISGPQAFHSTTKRTGTYKVHFSKAGKYHVICTIHNAYGMNMDIKVTS